MGGHTAAHRARRESNIDETKMVDGRNHLNYLTVNPDRPLQHREHSRTRGLINGLDTWSCVPYNDLDYSLEICVMIGVCFGEMERVK